MIFIFCVIFLKYTGLKIKFSPSHACYIVLTYYYTFLLVKAIYFFIIQMYKFITYFPNRDLNYST